MEPISSQSLRRFATEFADFQHDYAIIGGAACHLWFASRNGDFRRTQDVDLVLLLRSESQRFLQAFVDFLHRNDYQAESVELEYGTKKAHLYRFNNSTHPDLPAQIELLGPDDDSLQHALGQRCIPVKADGEYSGLSCMILNDAYYRLLQEWHRDVDGISVADENVLAVYKMKAYLNIMEARAAGVTHGSDGSKENANKHRNDVIRLLLEGDVQGVPVSAEIHADIQRFAAVLKSDTAVRTSLLTSFRTLHPALGVTSDTLDTLSAQLPTLFPPAEQS